MKKSFLIFLAVFFILACGIDPPLPETPQPAVTSSVSSSNKRALLTRLATLEEYVKNIKNVYEREEESSFLNIDEEMEAIRSLVQQTENLRDRLRSSSELAGIVESLKKRIEAIEQKLGIGPPVAPVTVEGSSEPPLADTKWIPASGGDAASSSGTGGSTSAANTGDAPPKVILKPSSSSAASEEGGSAAPDDSSTTIPLVPVDDSTATDAREDGTTDGSAEGTASSGESEGVAGTDEESSEPAPAVEGNKKTDTYS